MSDASKKAFKDKFGYEPSEQEAQFIDNQVAIQKGERPDTIVGALKDVYGRVDSRISQEAKAAGVDLSPDQIKSIRGNVLNLQDYANVGFAYGANRDSIVNASKELILPNLFNIKTQQQQNPTVTDDFKNQAAQVVQSIYGRAGSANEIDFFAKQLAQGESPYELEQFLKTTPEFMKMESEKENQRVQTESAAARESLNAELLKGEDEAFQRALPEIMSSYMKAGVLNSSGVDNAIARARADLASKRQGFLAEAGYNDAIRGQGYGREDFVNRNAQAFNSYLRQSEPAYQSRFAFTPGAQYQQNLGFATDRLNRSRSLEDYNRQQSDYERYFNQNRGDANRAAYWQLGGQLLGAGLQGATMYGGGK